uniref:Uncharacterized protein n=1 Tax=Anguilla anguilla TaxID=7936 RepID=A0A0E9QNB6_ANGAN
MKSKHKATNH